MGVKRCCKTFGCWYLALLLEPNKKIRIQDSLNLLHRDDTGDQFDWELGITIFCSESCLATSLSHLFGIKIQCVSNLWPNFAAKSMKNVLSRYFFSKFWMSIPANESTAWVS